MLRVERVPKESSSARKVATISMISYGNQGSSLYVKRQFSDHIDYWKAVKLTLGFAAPERALVRPIYGDTFHAVSS